MSARKELFNENIIACQKCERLMEYAKETTENGRKKEFLEDTYWCKPVPSFGSLDSETLIVGLAPGKHGAGRTGRPFTGDYAGEILYKALYQSGFSNSEKAISSNDGLELINIRIANAVRCAPPQNKPTNEEILNCRPYLVEEISLMKNLKNIFALGGLAHRQILQCIGEKQSHFKFGHGKIHTINGKKWKIVNSYHPSRYNINTKRLTYNMFLDVIQKLAN
jgi:uracil-DNA glycosylase family 4|tara:strand:- start:655 stop:1320 length:666 start_codon:yes stop_codon:yes gene_type:complete